MSRKPLPAPVDPDLLPFTHAELHHLLDVARAVTMRHRLFTMLGFEWDVDTRLMALMIVVHGRAPDRDAPSTYDAERYDIDTGLVWDRTSPPSYADFAEANYGTGLRGLTRITTMPQPRLQPLVPISAKLPIKVKRSQLADHQALVQHLAREARSALIYACTHEIDEMLRVDGRRVREPHEEFKFKVTL